MPKGCRPLGRGPRGSREGEERGSPRVKLLVPSKREQEGHRQRYHDHVFVPTSRLITKSALVYNHVRYTLWEFALMASTSHARQPRLTSHPVALSVGERERRVSLSALGRRNERGEGVFIRRALVLFFWLAATWVGSMILIPWPGEHKLFARLDCPSVVLSGQGRDSRVPLHPNDTRSCYISVVQVGHGFRSMVVGSCSLLLSWRGRASEEEFLSPVPTKRLHPR